MCGAFFVARIHGRNAVFQFSSFVQQKAPQSCLLNTLNYTKYIRVREACLVLQHMIALSTTQE